ncbi:hypothetical protein ISN44_As13g011410, partial [Arabidopsis suecica]
MNKSLIPPQGVRVYVREDPSNFYRGGNGHFPTLHINNIPQRSYVPQHTMNPNDINTQPIPSLGHHFDHDVARNVIMNQQYLHHHQTSDFMSQENFGNNFTEEDLVSPSSYWYVPEDTSLETRNVHEVVPSQVPSYDDPRSSFLDQVMRLMFLRQNGGLSYNSDESKIGICKKGSRWGVKIGAKHQD